MLTRQDFAGLVRSAVAGMGFHRDIAMVVFPVDQFLVESDISPIGRDIGEFIAGLTSWEPPARQKGSSAPPRLRIEAGNHEEATDRFNRLFLNNLWGDGLPLAPPTEARVKWISRGTDMAPEAEVGRVMPRGGIATVETLAVALAMAGGRPEYLAVLIAAMSAILDAAMHHDKWQTTSASTFPTVIVNGPVARDIRLNAGFGLLGPDPGQPAGAAIGRAIRLVQQNVGGALPGVGTMAMFGGMRYTNAVFAEDEDGLPAGWQPLNVERLGHPRGTNSVTVFAAAGAANIFRRGIGTEALAEEALQSLYRIAGYLRVPNVHYLRGYEDGTPGALLISRAVAGQLSGLGWTKEKIKQFLWQNSKVPLAEVERTGIIQWIDSDPDPRTVKAERDPWPIARRPDNLMIVVAGGAHPTHAYWLQGCARHVGGGKIDLPANWRALIDEAEVDLGPIEAACRVSS